MSQRKVRRFAAAAAFAAILFMAAAPVQARDIGPAPRVLLWLQDLWAKGASVFEGWPAAFGSSGGPRKAGPGSDPNGSPSPSSTAPMPGTSDQG